ncbi:hypothetical protein NE237_000525 [Protea cynaroides]|uniref:Protein TIFY n=1 Tax=Protea cynaroides TaxID=273540 RepID=A0A9Q0QXK1_9MAGN|nr:hypothetical protein NE237_000525 [Protea cynaroides]
MNLPLSVRRNCNLDLRLPPAPIDFLPVKTGSDDGTITERSAVETPQQLTIFYNGRICVCDVTELQARTIICQARKEMEERMNTPRSEPMSPFESQIHSPAGMSMKKSLQQFLQKRKNRVQATSPYNKQS